MGGVMHRVVKLSVVAVSLAGLAAVTLPALAANPMQDLPGRWSGWGTISLASGNREQVKCVATYFVAGGGAGLQQNLRCASPSYKIDASTNLKVSGSKITGTWEEKSYAATGAVSGTLSDSGFNMAIRGDAFSASMQISTSSCKQSVNITPQGLDVTRVSINLSKC